MFIKTNVYRGAAGKPTSVTWEDHESYASIHAVVAVGTVFADLPSEIENADGLRDVQGVVSVLSRTKEEPYPK